MASDEPLEQSDPYRYEKTNQWPVIATDGLGTPYAIPNIKTEFLRTHTGMRISPLRGVGATANTFASESFMDEIAQIKGVDPIELRLALLEGHSTAQDVIQAVAELAEWHQRRSSRVRVRRVGRYVVCDRGSDQRGLEVRGHSRDKGLGCRRRRDPGSAE